MIVGHLLVSIVAVLSTGAMAQRQYVLNDPSSMGYVVRCHTPVNHRVTKTNVPALLDRYNVDLWAQNSAEGWVDLRLVDPTQLRLIEDVLGVSRCETMVDDVAALVQSEKTATLWSADSLAQDEKEDPEWGFFKDYRTFDQLISKVKTLAEQYPHLATFTPSIGKTHEGRDIVLLHITAGIDQPNRPKKKVIWMNGGIHAREWISSHTATFIITSLLTQYGKNKEITYLLDNIEFIIAPHINPDGYEFSRTQDRMWRKNRRHNRDGSFGVDLNRNFDIYWGGRGASSSPWSETYRGPSAASEPETQAIQAYASKVNATIGIDLHSYGQLLMRPYGWTLDDHPNEPVNRKLGDGMRDVIKASGGARYTSQKSAGLYPVTGGLDDWLTSQGMIGFTFELRDSGRHGFVLPKDQILPTGLEIVEAIKFMGKFMVENY